MHSDLTWLAPLARPQVVWPSIALAMVTAVIVMRAGSRSSSRRVRMIDWVVRTVTADGAGIVLALAIARRWSIAPSQELWFAAELAFLFGWLLAQYHFARAMGYGPLHALEWGACVQVFSLPLVIGATGLVMEVVAPRVVGEQAGVETHAFWGFALLSLLLASVAAYPMHFWLSAIGWGPVGTATTRTRLRWRNIAFAAAVLPWGAASIPGMSELVARGRVISGALQAIPEAPASPARLVSGFELELRGADEALQAGRRTPAVMALDAARRIAIVLDHAAPGLSTAGRREAVERARVLLQRGSTAEARELVAWLAHAPPSSRDRAAKPRFGSSNAGGYVGATVIDAAGQRIGTVAAVHAHDVELALEPVRSSPANAAETLPPRMRVDARELVFGPQGALGSAIVAAPALNPRALRVCADPNNLPFSDRRGQGLENRLAELLASELHAQLSYEWSPERRGFIRRTLRAGRCDVIMGLPSGFERVLSTRPVYRSGYAFVYGSNTPRVHSLDSPELRSLRIGVPLVGDDGSNPSPIVALAKRDLIANLRGYPVYGDYRHESPPADLVRAVRRGEIDLAIAWGPLAGYYSQRESPALETELLPDDEAPTGQPFSFDISLAVRRDQPELRDELDAALVRRHEEISALLDRFQVPRP